jgi:hypothetical protein
MMLPAYTPLPFEKGYSPKKEEMANRGTGRSYITTEVVSISVFLAKTLKVRTSTEVEYQRKLDPTESISS